jgi:subtilisin-like proprotein convertase family protein
MPAVTYNFLLEQGSDFEISFQYNDANNSPINLSDKCVVLQWIDSGKINKQIFSTAALAQYDTNDWSLTADNRGRIRFRISANLTQNYNFDTAIYDLDIISLNNRLRNTRLATGTITLVKRNLELVSNCPSSLDPNINLITSTPTPLDGGVTPTPTLSITPDNSDLCLPDDCIDLDIYSVVHTGVSLVLSDLCLTSGNIRTTDTRSIENIELAINKLQHQSPSDLIFVLAPPSGNKILLSANSKIKNYNNNFSFMFSNKANTTDYLYNTTNGGLINIYDKKSNINFSNETLLSSFDHLFGASVTGTWSLIVKDTDPVGSGLLDSWKLIITHSPAEDL